MEREHNKDVTLVRKKTAITLPAHIRVISHPPMRTLTPVAICSAVSLLEQSAGVNGHRLLPLHPCSSAHSHSRTTNNGEGYGGGIMGRLGERRENLQLLGDPAPECSHSRHHSHNPRTACPPSTPITHCTHLLK